MALTVKTCLEEQRQFIHDGVIIRRGFIPLDLVRTARHLVEKWYETCFEATAIEQYTQKTFAPNLGSHPDLLNVYHLSGLECLCASLVHPALIQPVLNVQIQIRVPHELQPLTQPEKGMHVDGVACPHLDPRELRTFTLLVGVPLSEIDEVDQGALRYLPGAHMGMAEWFRCEWTRGITDQVPSSIGARSDVAFLGRPGDVIILHHLVPHAVGSNRTVKPRLMLYFRVKHERHEQFVLDALCDPWLEFPELRSLAR